MLNPPPSKSICLLCQARVSARLGTLSRQPRSRSYARASTAPKPVLDIKHIARNPGLYSQNCRDRNYKELSENPWQILELTQRRSALYERERNARQRKSVVKKAIKQLCTPEKLAYEATFGQSDEDAKLLAELKAEAKELKVNNESAAREEKEIDSKLEELALGLPNLSSTYTPSGSEPDVLRIVGNEAESALVEGKSHVDIGTQLGILDFVGAGTSSGWGWYYLVNEGAMLEQALVQYALQTLHKAGWTIVSPPSVVYSHIAVACGFQPRDQNGEQQVYNIQQLEKDAGRPSLSLAATAEIPLAGMYANRMLEETSLPLKTVAVSRCYRAEAGSRGVDTKGLYRVHEFTKVEMFAWTLPDEVGEDNLGPRGSSHSEMVFDEIVKLQEHILTGLGLPYRLLEMSSEDLGASASRKQDIEVFFPSRKDRNQGWGEVTSASICTDYQSRRLLTRMKWQSARLGWPHTVNGTAMAIPRVLAAILEHGWNAETQSVAIPAVLWPWMYGLTSITRN